MWNIKTIALVIASSLVLSQAFVATTVQSSSRTDNRSLPTTVLFAENNEKAQNRRDFLKSTAFISTATTFSSILPFNLAASAEEEVSSSSGFVTVIGASGRTGKECVKACLENKLPVKATTRSGSYDALSDVDSSNLLSFGQCDVRDAASVSSTVEGARAVIFAASASKEGGKPSAVDNDGLVNVAKACIAAQVPHLVIVSSGGVSKPDSPVYKFLNIFGNIMAEKIKGEDTVRDLYKQNDNKALVYTVVRPGGLTEDAPKGVAALELNQGDTKSGRIARADVAAICVNSILYPKLTRDATFECYDADTGKPLESVGMSNIMKKKTSDEESKGYSTGRECRGASWEEMFGNLKADF